MIRRRILVEGGLGNVLFQFAFAHLLSMRGIDTNLVFKNRDSIYRDFREVTHFCNHGIRIDSSRKIDEFEETISNSKIYWKVSKSLYSPFLDTRRMHPSGIEINRGTLLYRGYFQSVSLISDALESTLQCLQRYLNNFYGSSPKFEHAPIIHIRKYDSEAFGNLDKTYFTKVLMKYSIQKANCISNTKSNFISFFNDSIKVNYIESEDLTPFSIIDLMRKSELLICSNSTLSWWGGLLGRVRDGNYKMIIPRPFYKSPVMAFHNSDMYLPTMMIEKSIWEIDSKE